MTTINRQKFKIYVRPSGELKVKKKPSQVSQESNNPSSVAFVLRHITGHTCEEQLKEAERLMKVVQMTDDDKKVIEQLLKNRCPE